MALVTRRINEPVWCTKTDHSDSTVGIHKSNLFSVGDRYRGRGEVGVYLIRGGDGPTSVAVNAAHGASCTVEIGIREAIQLRDYLDFLLEQAGRENLNGQGRQ